MEYDLKSRRRLGREVRTARHAAGLSNTAEWADRVGRSGRILLGLERGEPAGPDTYASVAKALGWPLKRVYDLLDGKPIVDESAPPALASVSDEELAAEVLRRMRKAGEHGGDTAPTKLPGSGPAQHLRAVAAGDEGDEDLAAEADRRAAAARARQQAEIDRMTRKGDAE